MQHRHLVAVAVLAVVLAGCTAPAPTPTEPPAPTQAATPTATAEADPGPVVRVDATCDDFADSETLATLVPGADLQLVSDPASDLDRYSLRQHGSLACTWGPGGGNSFTQRIEVAVVPGVSSSLWGDVQPIASGGSGVVSGGYHGDAYSDCRAIPGGRSCRLDALIGDWYLGVVMYSTEKAAEGVSREWGDPFLQHAADLVAALPDPAPAWQPADATPAPADYWQPLVADGGLADDLGYQSTEVAFVAPTPQSPAEWFSADSTGFRIAYLQAISGTKAQNINVQWLPGGAWAWNEASVGGTPFAGVGDEAVTLTSGTDVVVVFRVGGNLAAVTAQKDGAPSGADLTAAATVTAQHVAALLG